MENVPIAKVFGFIRWWAGLKPTQKNLVVLMVVIFFLLTVNVYQYADLARKQAEKSALEKENLYYAKDCEKRVAAVTIVERNRSDSLITIERNKIEMFYNRTPILKERNNNIENALK